MKAQPRAAPTKGTMKHACMASEVTRLNEPCLTIDRAQQQGQLSVVPHGGAQKGDLTGVPPYGLFRALLPRPQACSVQFWRSYG